MIKKKEEGYIDQVPLLKRKKIRRDDDMYTNLLNLPEGKFSALYAECKAKYESKNQIMTIIFGTFLVALLGAPIFFFVNLLRNFFEKASVFSTEELQAATLTLWIVGILCFIFLMVVIVIAIIYHGLNTKKKNEYFLMEQVREAREKKRK